MRPATFELRIDRVLVVGPELDPDRARELRALIEKEMRERLESLTKPVQPYEGEAVRVDLPDLAPESPEYARRVARAAADVVENALRGKES
jgi:hypothetical protein